MIQIPYLVKSKVVNGFDKTIYTVKNELMFVDLSKVICASTHDGYVEYKQENGEYVPKDVTTKLGEQKIVELVFSDDIVIPAILDDKLLDGLKNPYILSNSSYGDLTADEVEYLNNPTF